MPKMTVIDDPLAKEEHLKLGQAYEQEGNLDLAEKEYLLAQPRPEAYLALGNLYFSRSKEPQSIRKAEEYYRKALNSAPSPEAANNLAWLYLSEGKLLGAAERLAQRALTEGYKARLSPENIKNFEDTLTQIQKARAAAREKKNPSKK
ncbi:MAG: hypothetical protein LBP22_13870 [Deltaproteobacteria bacterium]|nr:hypothetical protein [Deltaproteobacteria bacterium]